MVVIPPSLLDAGDDPALRGAPLAVLVWLWGHLESHHYRAVKVSALGSTLRIKRQNVGRALDVLAGNGYLEEGRPDGQYRTFRVVETRSRPYGARKDHLHAC